MTITDSQGRVRIREFRILRLDVADGGEQKFYVYFKKPADVSKMVFMVWKHLGVDDDRWMYLPALDLVRRIASSDKRSSFVGSHFVYEDVSGRGIDADTHELIDATDKDYVIKDGEVVIVDEFYAIKFLCQIGQPVHRVIMAVDNVKALQYWNPR